MQMVTIVSTIVLIIGGIYTIRGQIKKSKEESQAAIIQSIKTEINPIQIDLENKKVAINDLWKDLERLEDDLTKLQIESARTAGFIEVQTPLMKEIREQIDVLKSKIETIHSGMNIK